MPHREILPIFHHTAKEASEIGEMEQWQSSHRENVACKEYIEMTIRENFDGTE